MVRLNAYGWSVEEIAAYMRKHPHTVRASLHRWKKAGVEGLLEKGGRGRKKKWQEEDFQYLEQSLETEQRTDNSHQLSQKLTTERGVSLSADRLFEDTQKKGWAWRRTRQQQYRGVEPTVKEAKRADLDWLLWAHSES